MTTWNKAALLATFDEDQRRRLTYPLLLREATPHIIRHRDEANGVNFITYSHLNADNADDVIRNEIAFFTALGQRFEWKLYAHDQPSDLQARLVAHGFSIEDEEAIVVLPLAEAPPALYDLGGVDVRRLTDPDDLEALVTIESAVWGEDESAHVQHLSAELRAAPDLLSIYAAYVDGQPACCGWVRFAPGSAFAGLWGGSTVAEYRGRGLYRAVVAARAQEARDRGITFLNVDASAMSRPILERLGFQTITHSWPCMYTPAARSST
ncbi:MAG: GNAT family N-acetyltransferase [Anaerolineae bacterium]|nr:GNAT family N-acetyltransferase [Anaerolineae bacterium]